MSSISATAKASLRNLLIPRQGVYPDTTLCHLVFVSDLWRDKKEHLVLIWLRNGAFETLCKIQLGILTCCCLRTLSVQRLFDDHHLVRYVFSLPLFDFHTRYSESVSGSLAKPTSPQYSLRLPSRALQPNGEKETTTDPFVVIKDPEQRTGHFQTVHLLRLHLALLWHLDGFLFLGEPGSFVWQQDPLWTWRTRYP